jgi:cyclophilin family peptidyl-prolyl cis-trans isomerase
MTGIVTSIACFLVAAAAVAQPAPKAQAPASANPQVLIETSKGNITVELFADKAPKTVKNFLDYVKSGHYSGTIFHRVMPGFMIQGGGFNSDMSEKDSRPPIQNEADNGVPNQRGTLAMARTPDPNSASDQFFINVANNGFLNHRSKTPDGWGYAVFGKVLEGMDVVDAIVKVPTTSKGPHQSVPVEPVVIRKASVVTASEKK